MPGGLRITEEFEGRRHDKGCGYLPSTLMSEFLRTQHIFVAIGWTQVWPRGACCHYKTVLKGNSLSYERFFILKVKT